LKQNILLRGHFLCGVASAFLAQIVGFVLSGQHHVVDICHVLYLIVGLFNVARYWSARGVCLADRAKLKSTCHFCQTPVARGAVRFKYIHNEQRPQVSMHPFCILSVPAHARQVSKANLEIELQRHSTDPEIVMEIQTALQHWQ
jgi:hypothetical protein